MFEIARMSELDMPADLRTRIESVEDRSSERTNRLSVSFRNGYTLSVISGEGTYADLDTFEIAVFDPAGKLFKTAEFSEYEDVLGYQTIEEITAIAFKISAL